MAELNLADVTAVAAPPADTSRPTTRTLKLTGFRTYVPGNAVEKRPTRPDGVEKPVAPTPDTGLSPEVMQEQTLAIEQRIQRLIKMSDETVFEDMMNNPDSGGIHWMDRELLNLLTQQKATGHGTERYTIDRNALNQLMSTTRGQEIAYAVRQYDLITAMLGAAIRVTITPNSGPPSMVQGESIPISGRGFLRAVADKYSEVMGRSITDTEGRPSENIVDANNPSVGDVIKTLLQMSGGTALLGMGAGIAGGPLGIALGGVAGALVPPAIAGLMHAAAAGERIEVTQCIQALRTLSGGESQPPGRPRPTLAGPIEAGQRLWLREFAGIDPTDLEVYQNDQGQEAIRYRPNHIPHTLHDGRTLRDRLVAESNALRKVQEAMGVPKYAAQGSDIDWIFNGNNGPYTNTFNYNGPSMPGQRGLDWDRKIMDRFDPNRGGIQFWNPQTNNWEQLELPVPTTGGDPGWVTNPYLERVRTRPVGFPFNRGRAQEMDIRWDMEGNARRWMDAQRDVLRDEIRLAADEIRNGNVNYVDRYAQSIRDQIAARGENGEARRQRVQEAERRRDLYETLGTRTDQEGWTTYETAVSNLIRARTNLETLQQELTTDVTNPQGDAATAFAAPRAGMTPEEAALNEVLTNRVLGGATVELNGETIESIQAQITDVNTTIARDVDAFRIALLGGRAATADDQRQIAEYKASLEATKQQLLAPIQDQQRRAQERIRELRNAREAVRNQLTELGERAQLNGDRQRTLAQNEAAFTRLTAPGIAGIAPITPAELTTVTYEDLLQRVNALGFWPQAENGLEQNQRILLRAMAEARAQTTLPPRTPDYTAATDPAGWALSENQLATLDVARISALMAARAPAIGAPVVPNAGAIQTLKDEAAQLIRVRGEAVTALEDDLTRQQNVAEAQANRAANPLELRPLQLMQRTTTRWREYDAELLNMQATNNNTADLRLLTDTTPVAPIVAGNPSEYVAQEVNFPIAYTRWLNLIFDYQRANDIGGRGAAFDSARQLLPAATLADLLNTRFNFGTPGILATSTALENAIAAGTISASDIRRFIQQDVVLGYLAPRVTTQ